MKISDERQDQLAELTDEQLRDELKQDGEIVPDVAFFMIRHRPDALRAHIESGALSALDLSVLKLMTASEANQSR